MLFGAVSRQELPKEAPLDVSSLRVVNITIHIDIRAQHKCRAAVAAAARCAQQETRPFGGKKRDFLAVSRVDRPLFSVQVHPLGPSHA